MVGWGRHPPKASSSEREMTFILRARTRANLKRIADRIGSFQRAGEKSLRAVRWAERLSSIVWMTVEKCTREVQTSAVNVSHTMSSFTLLSAPLHRTCCDFNLW